MPTRRLTGVVLKIAPGNPEAAEQEGPEHDDEQRTNTAALMIVGSTDQKQPCVIERIGAHVPRSILAVVAVILP